MGLGSSAGGLDALRRLLSHLPERPGLAFVAVQHVDPRHRSMLAELLAHHTRMRVLEAADGMRPSPDEVHLVAPGALLTLEDGAYRLAAPAEATARSPIDVFFRSLAADRGERAVGIVLSGAGHDGSAGLRAIHERGGLTLAQAPESALRDDMPRSAIEAGVVDHVLAPEEMPAKLLEHGAYLRDAASAGGAREALDAQLAERLPEICAVVLRQTGHDFAGYREGTLQRRIRRRVQVRHLDTAGDYLRLLEGDAAEAEALVRDLLVGVTQFFRDPEAFEELAREAIPRVVRARAPAAPVRVWVPGCASGEEAYSIAILVREHLERIGASRPVQIFATDLDAELLAEARKGRYPSSIAEQVDPERLARFFSRDRQGFEVARELRETCVFSRHSVIRDPPYSQVDLVSCRNLLIYLGADLQRKLVTLFHYALRPGGILFLGSSEGIARGTDLFEPLGPGSKIFLRREDVTRPPVEFPLGARPPADRAAPTSSEPAPKAPPERVSAVFERMVLEEYSHPCAVVDERGDLLLVAGPIARLLQLPAGTPSSNLVESVRGSLRIELRAALEAASRTGRRVVREGVPIEVDDAPRAVRLVVRPMPPASPGSRLFLVVLQERVLPEEDDGAAVSQLEPPAIQRLEDELRSTRAELETTVEALEASNEELVSTNEELQSANEELQNSREELQSLNEELETVNAELRSKVDELATANGDLQNLFESTDIATIFLDRELRVARFTPAATALFRLREGDVGRPIDDLAPRFVGAELGAVSREVLRTLAPFERQVRGRQGDGWFLLRVAPYRTVEDRIAGLVVTCVDVSAHKAAEEALRMSEERLRRSQEIAHLGSWELDLETNRLVWSDEVYRIFGLQPQQFGASYEAFLEAVHPEDRAAVDAAYAGSVREGRDSYEIVHRVVRRSTGEVRVVHEKCHHLRDAGGRIVRSVGMVHDVTERRRDEARLAYLASFPERNPNPIVEADATGRVSYANPAALRLFPDIRERGGEHPWLAGWTEVARSLGEGSPASVRLVTVGDRTFHQALAYAPEEGVVRAYGFDITDRRRAEEAVERSRTGLSRLAAASLTVMASADLEDMLRAIADAAVALSGARLATCGWGLASGQLVVVGAARAPGAPTFPPGNMFARRRGGVHEAVAQGRKPIRLTDGELRAHGRWWGLPEGHVPLRGLLGVPILARGGEAGGMILVTDREQGDFTGEDESLLEQLATVASLALQHVEARIRLEGADRHKNQFLAMLSHELRNPLAPVRNSLHVLAQAEPSGEQARRALAVIDRQVEHMTRLVDELLDVTRISRGKIRLRREPLDFAELVRRAVEDHRSVFSANGLALQVGIPRGEVRIEGDRTRMAQVIGNLLQNAAKFTPPGGTVTVSVEVDEGLGQVVARVRDTGPGIGPGMLPRLFEPFTQADTTLERSKGGLGLGLALVKGLVEMHRGTVGVASEGPGKGAEFVIRLPRQASGPAPVAEPPARRGRDGPRRRVLVIEDNADAAESMREMLQLDGHTVEVASSGPAGLEKALTFEPNVVLCDIGLPGTDGYEVARTIRAHPALRTVTLVALTGYAGPDDVVRAKEAGFDHHLAKPIGTEEIDRVLS